MAKDTKKYEWADVLELASTNSGIPKKQIEEDCNAVNTAIGQLLEEKQPKRDNESIEVDTPFAQYRSTRMPETIITNVAGDKVVRPPCCLVNVGIPTDYVTKANIGLVDKDTSVKPVDKSKSA